MELLIDYVLFLQNRSSYILNAFLEHIIIAGTAVGLGSIVTIPIAIIISKVKGNLIQQVVFTIANIFQTIPSLALLAILIPLMGIGMKPAIFALFLFSLLPILRNTYAGINSVDPGVIESARGMGYNTWQLLFQIEIPLAIPYIMSGVRVATVYIISWTTLATLIGAGGLGDLIFAGMGVRNNFLVVTGALSAIILALVVDSVLGRIEKKVYFARGQET